MSHDIHTKISQSIIANQLAMNFNHEIKHTEYFKGSLKAKIRPLQLELIKAERAEYDKIFNEAERPANDVYNALEEMVNEIASLGIMHCEVVTELVKAFKKDSKSIEGIINKINRKP